MKRYELRPKRYELRSVGGMGMDAVEIRESKSGEWVRYREVPQWVSVKERLPRLGEYVLWLYPDGEQRVSKFHGKAHRYSNRTYWMPLPEPPE